MELQLTHCKGGEGVEEEAAGVEVTESGERKNNRRNGIMEIELTRFAEEGRGKGREGKGK